MSQLSCRVVKRHMDALVDGELDTTAQIDFESHISTCPICREQVLFARSVKAATKRALGDAKAPDALRARLLTALQSAPVRSHGTTIVSPTPVATPAASPKPRAEGVRAIALSARYAIPAAAAAVVFVVLAVRGGGSAPDSDEAMTAAAVPLFEDVVRRHATPHPAEVQGPPPQVAGWFRGKLEFPVRPVVLAEPDSRLIGARLSNVRERDAAAFFYDVHGRRVTVLVFEPPQVRYDDVAMRVRYQGHDVYYRQVRGYTVPVVQHEGLTYAFTGDLDSQSMIRLAATSRVAH